ncbi:MAG: hypothetical protein QOE61_1358 [Micromonosporaceae bacterium]|jgi:crotonobetainyl-CoA:carnitine CoA-transferase CaiB-like acyl-CoA transferase|nr:hypothetical protein [Micromonosporaceae bacterium]
MTRPLQGVRILAIEQFGAGPFGSLHLADLGAEVISWMSMGDVLIGFDDRDRVHLRLVRA